jgi:hypothetical protein
VSEATRVRVELADRSYDIVVGSGLLARSGDELASAVGAGDLCWCAFAGVIRARTASISCDGIEPVVLYWRHSYTPAAVRRRFERRKPNKLSRVNRRTICGTQY